ncbi:MAG: LrgB family protein [Gammaproteobacteria bacterium]|jgi:predicted murein hydrolase (TIGR00659 family)|nr:LrgB family protein [Gammaproteobacteria bacterium]
MWFVVTLVVYLVARRISTKLNFPLFNPLLLSLLVLIPLLMSMEIPYQRYFADNTWLNWLLQPAVVALAYSLYQCLPEIRRHWKLILSMCTVGSLLSMLLTASFAIQLGADSQLLATLMGKSVTTPIAMQIASHLGGIPAVAAIMVIMVGIFGAIIAYPMFKLLNIQSPLARGLTMGCVAHAIGTAASVKNEPEDSAYSSLSLALCGIITSITASSMMAFALWINS